MAHKISEDRFFSSRVYSLTNIFSKRLGEVTRRDKRNTFLVEMKVHDLKINCLQILKILLELIIEKRLNCRKETLLRLHQKILATSSLLRDFYRNQRKIRFNLKWNHKPLKHLWKLLIYQPRRTRDRIRFRTLLINFLWLLIIKQKHATTSLRKKLNPICKKNGNHFDLPKTKYNKKKSCSCNNIVKEKKVWTKN